MENVKMQPVLTKEDYRIIMDNLNGGMDKHRCSRQEAEALVGELKRAKLVPTSKIDPNVVRLNSFVSICNRNENKIIELVLVTPDKADIKQRKISVLSPMGAALIGYAKGETISWVLPAGIKTFTIVDVRNNMP
ncbi:MAG TPA: GreA/GreB family elongation factor [Chitinophagaceae bacterium]